MTAKKPVPVAPKTPVHTAAKPAKPATPAKAPAKKATAKSAKTATAKTTATAKSAAATAKHTAHVKHEQHVAHEQHLAAEGKAGFGIGDWLPVCSFEALAQSLRLAGQFVHDDEVAGLWELAGADPLGASVGAALDTASLHGLAGFRPQRVKFEGLAPVRVQDHLPLPFGQDEAAPLSPLDDLFAGDVHGLILRIDVPGPHAVLATADGWWSWGELYSPWPARVSEAWAVSWS